MTLYDLIYNMNGWQWSGVLWMGFLLSWTIIRVWDKFLLYVYSYLTSGNDREVLERLMKAVEDSGDGSDKE